MSAPDSAGAAALALRGLGRRYGTLAAVEGVDLGLARGEIICLLGSSGCGKTTLLRLIAGLEAPDAGSVHMDGAALSGPGVFVPPEQRHIGLVFQDYALFPHLDLLGNVMFGLRGDRAQREDAARAALARVGLAQRAGSFPHMLSGGEQQRVALARALAPQPRLLLMDEPFSNLDRGLRDRVRAETLAILREAGITAVIVTHDPEEALRIADRIVLMRDGRIEQQDDPETLYCRPASLYAARFCSDLMEIEGRCHAGRVATALGNFEAAGLAEGTAVRVALRPHHLSLAPEGVPAHVQAHTFLGASRQLRVTVAGLAEPLDVQVFGPCAARAGDTVRLRVDAAAAHVFAVSPDANSRSSP